MNKSTVCGIMATALSLLVLASGHASAEEGGWYINGSFHHTQLEDADNKDRVETTSCILTSCSTETTETDYESQFGSDDHPSLAIGYDISGPYRTDLEYRKLTNDVKGSGVPIGDNSRDTKALLFNLWRDFQPIWNFTTYVGGGLGIALVEQGNVDDKIAFGQLGLGVTWSFTNRFAAELGYRYFIGEPKPLLSGSSRVLETDYKGQAFVLGIRYNFFD